MNKQNFRHLIPVSFIGSGSSAFTDLLTEYQDVSAPHGSFEYVFLHCPDGLFDLADKLLVGNNALRSDEAIHSFLKRMQALNHGRWWVGHYDQRLGPIFIQSVKNFLQKLIDISPEYYWYEQEKFTYAAYPYLILRKIIKILSRNRLQLSLPLTYKPMLLAWPTQDKFFKLAKEFINSITEHYLQKQMTFLPKSDTTSLRLIWDQLLLPHNLWRFGDYFDNRYAALVITRDPRDVFLSNKYIWSKNNEPVPYPTDAKSFCQMYKRLRSTVSEFNHPQIFTYAFEDLVYNYKKTCQQLEKDLGLTSQQHIAAYTKFNPKHSINNTQLWLSNSDWLLEAELIKQELTTYCYQFPYTHTSDTKLSF